MAMCISVSRGLVFVDKRQGGGKKLEAKTFGAWVFCRTNSTAVKQQTSTVHINSSILTWVEFNRGEASKGTRSSGRKETADKTTNRVNFGTV
ncbi:hypothetical protein QG37_04504 [Candidozyma auris]|nr:hypothetical protein QG37_04504 [[Candida] auris]